MCGYPPIEVFSPLQLVLFSFLAVLRFHESYYIIPFLNVHVSVQRPCSNFGLEFYVPWPMTAHGSVLSGLP
jgi:hypothetical protein